jgi:hypothetical protein
MAETSVICVKVDSIRKKGFHNLREWMKNENNVYIGRRGVILLEPEGGGTKRRFPEEDSIWANPFKIDKNGTREDVIAKYETYIREKLAKDNSLIEKLLKLKGKTLGCWCHPDPCHGDVLVKLIGEYDAIKESESKDEDSKVEKGNSKLILQNNAIKESESKDEDSKVEKGNSKLILQNNKKKNKSKTRKWKVRNTKIKQNV